MEDSKSSSDHDKTRSPCITELCVKALGFGSVGRLVLDPAKAQGVSSGNSFKQQCENNVLDAS